jgi:methylase of polypeptide subunit release factors
VVSFLAKEVLSGLPTSFFATDLNQHAIEATAATARANNVSLPSHGPCY